MRWSTSLYKVAWYTIRACTSRPSHQACRPTQSYQGHPGNGYGLQSTNEFPGVSASSVTSVVSITYRVFFWFLPRVASAECGDEIAFVCPSDRPSVTIRYHEHKVGILRK